MALKTALTAQRAKQTSRAAGRPPEAAETAEALPPARWRRMMDWAHRVGLTRYAAIALTIAAIASGMGTYWALSGSRLFEPDPKTILILLNVDFVLLLLLGALIARRVVRLWAQRRRGLAGSRLHARLVLLFSLVAVTPAIVVAVFSAVFFNFGIQAWFSERVHQALTESLKVTDAYLREHQQAIRADALAMASVLNRNALLLLRSPEIFQRAVEQQVAARALLEAVVFDETGTVLATAGLDVSIQKEHVPQWALDRAKKGEVAVVAEGEAKRVRALVRLDQFFNTYLYVGRFMDPTVVGHVAQTRRAVEAYQKLEGQRSGLQISFFLLYAVVALLLLMAAVWVGLLLSNQLMKPIGDLIAAADRVRRGDLSARVVESKEDVDIGGLGRAFNRMAKRLERNRRELMDANRQIDARRMFTETVLAGVTAGVIGLDANGRINLPNRSASELLATNLDEQIGKPLASVVPEMAELVKRAQLRRETLDQTELVISRGGVTRTLTVRVSTELTDGEPFGYVVTFDDITELQSAQRTAAWADVARRIAHEIKNPLTPIQLSAERLKRKYLKEVDSEPELFETLADTIVRQVGDIGRMVDEFSAFARMPAPVMREEDLCEICRQAAILQRSAHGNIEYEISLPESPITVSADRGQISQAVTNLLQNAADSILDRKAPGGQESPRGRIAIAVSRRGRDVVVEVDDDGQGLPKELQHRLTEPYVTTRKKGTGLGLAIVAKIMEDHGGQLMLENREGGGARARLIFLNAADTTEVRHETPAKVVGRNNTKRKTAERRAALHGS
jgi:two-component system, NtrC family, nitrogen regulation sensor histidine kinase NtrY